MVCERGGRDEQGILERVFWAVQGRIPRQLSFSSAVDGSAPLGLLVCTAATKKQGGAQYKVATLALSCAWLRLAHNSSLATTGGEEC